MSAAPLQPWLQEPSQFANKQYQENKRRAVSTTKPDRYTMVIKFNDGSQETVHAWR